MLKVTAWVPLLCRYLTKRRKLRGYKVEKEGYIEFYPEFCQKSGEMTDKEA
jgi:hypothetical protein